MLRQQFQYSLSRWLTSDRMQPLLQALLDWCEEWMAELLQQQPWSPTQLLQGQLLISVNIPVLVASSMTISAAGAAGLA